MSLAPEHHALGLLYTSELSFLFSAPPLFAHRFYSAAENAPTGPSQIARTFVLLRITTNLIATTAAYFNSFAGWIVFAVAIATSALLYASEYRYNTSEIRDRCTSLAQEAQATKKGAEELAEECQPPPGAWFFSHVSLVNFVFDRPGVHAGSTAQHGIIVILNITVVIIFVFVLIIEEPLTNAWGCYYGFTSLGANYSTLQFGVCPQYPLGIAQPGAIGNYPVCRSAYPPDDPNNYIQPYATGGEWGASNKECEQFPAASRMLQSAHHTCIYILMISLGMYIGAAPSRWRELSFSAANAAARSLKEKVK